MDPKRALARFTGGGGPFVLACGCAGLFLPGVLALEIEWNNPFFDRDLENFKRLHANGAISA
jgi:hypothetical protein